MHFKFQITVSNAKTKTVVVCVCVRSSHLQKWETASAQLMLLGKELPLFTWWNKLCTNRPTTRKKLF